MSAWITTDWMSTLTAFISQHLAPSVATNPLPLLMIGAFILVNLVLFGMTRGREFLVMGYSAIVFLLPLVRFG